MAETADLSGDTIDSPKHACPEELLSSLLAGYKKPEDLFGEKGLHTPSNEDAPIFKTLLTQHVNQRRFVDGMGSPSLSAHAVRD